MSVIIRGLPDHLSGLRLLFLRVKNPQIINFNKLELVSRAGVKLRLYSKLLYKLWIAYNTGPKVAIILFHMRLGNFHVLISESMAGREFFI